MNLRKLLRKAVCSLTDCSFLDDPDKSPAIKEAERISDRLDRIVTRERERRVNPIESVIVNPRRRPHGGTR